LCGFCTAMALALFSAALSCPGHGGTFHARCEMVVHFQDSCARVSKEVTSRIKGVDSGKWEDPHNNGTYALTSATATKIEGSRNSSDDKYMDLWDMELEPTEENGCKVTACSESQRLQLYSLHDESISYCNLHNLYCGDEESCTYVNEDGGKLRFKEVFGRCLQHDGGHCHKAHPRADKALTHADLRFYNSLHYAIGGGI